MRIRLFPLPAAVALVFLLASDALEEIPPALHGVAGSTNSFLYPFPRRLASAACPPSFRKARLENSPERYAS